MKLFAMIAVVALTVWIFATACRALSHSGLGWRIAFAMATLAGLALGVRLVTWTYYRSPTVQPYGYPFDFGGAEFFDGKWHGGLISRYFYLALLADIALGILTFVAPFRVAQLFVSRRKHESTLQAG